MTQHQEAGEPSRASATLEFSGGAGPPRGGNPRAGPPESSPDRVAGKVRPKWAATMQGVVRFALAGVFLVTACGKRPEVQPETLRGPPDRSNTLAVVGDVVITAEQFQAELNQRSAGHPERPLTTAQKESVLDDLMRTEVLFQQARAAGYDRDPQVLAGLRRLMVRRFEADHLGTLAPVTEAQVAAHYLTNFSHFGAPEQRLGAIIFLRLPATASAGMKATRMAEAAALRDQALQAAAVAGSRPDFGVLAQQHSADQASRYKGGEIGWLTLADKSGGSDPAVIQALFALRGPGAISPVVSTTQGLYLVKCVAVKPATVRPLSEVKDGLAQALSRDREDKAARDFYAAQKAKTRIEINRPLLESLSARPPPAGDAKPPRLPGN